MANRFPLIINTTSGNSVQELPSGDFLDLSNSGISNSGNIAVSGIVSATGNITGNYILGNGSQLSGIITSVANISSGTSNVTVVSSGGNVTVGVGGTGNVAVFATTGVYVTGVVSATGYITGGNLSGTNLTGTITTAAQTNITSVGTLSSLSVTGNVAAGNISATNHTGTTVSVTGTVTAGTFSGAGTSLTGTASSLTVGTATVAGTVTTAAQPNITSVGTLTSLNSGAISSSGTVTAANLNTGGAVSATGAITGAAITGSSLTVSTGNITAGNLLLSGFISDSAQLDIQTSAANANIVLTPNGTGNVNTGANLSVTGNVQGGNLRTAGLISATGAITGAAITGSSLTVSTGNVSAGNIVNNNANGVGNIGSSTTYFNTVFAKATSAQYADLAENYEADADYTPGTVVVFGGNKEITITNNSHDTAVAGVISTNPSYLMNAGQSGEWVLPVALTGRVPCRVQGPVNKGTVLVSGKIPGTAIALDASKFEPGCVVGKSLEIINSTDIVTIEIAVGRL
jgi:hypothetical protein